MHPLLTSSLAALALAVASQARADDDGTPIPGQLIVITNPGVSLTQLQAAHPTLSLTPLRHFTPGRIHLLAIPVGQEDFYEATLAADIDLVRAAEHNKTIASPEEGTTQSLFLRSQSTGLANQTAFGDINGPGSARRGPTATIVAVLDTGIAPHPDLLPRIAPGGYNFILDSQSVDESDCPFGSRMVGHGTYVAGLIALIDPNAALLPITVLDCAGIGNNFATACGIYHAINQGASVINMSFATTFSSDIVETAVKDAAAAGVVCVASVSNKARDTSSTSIFPADFEDVIGVGAVDHSSQSWSIAPFSDWGPSVDLAAPGVNILSTWFDGAEFGYATGSGTSYPAAWTSGVCSILRAKFGQRSIDWTQERLCSSAQIVNIGLPFSMGCDHRSDGLAAVLNAAAAVCPADINADLFTDAFDYDLFVLAFEAGDGIADFNNDGFLDAFDYDDFVLAFETGC